MVLFLQKKNKTFRAFVNLSSAPRRHYAQMAEDPCAPHEPPHHAAGTHPVYHHAAHKPLQTLLGRIRRRGHVHHPPHHVAGACPANKAGIAGILAPVAKKVAAAAVLTGVGVAAVSGGPGSPIGPSLLPFGFGPPGPAVPVVTPSHPPPDPSHPPTPVPEPPGIVIWLTAVSALVGISIFRRR